MFKAASPIFAILIACLLLFTLPLPCAWAQQLEGGPTAFPDSLYQHYDWRSFEQLPAAQDTIDPTRIDQGLLNAAVFYTTNMVREYHGRKPFRFSATLRNMAAFHAEQMAMYKFVGHVNYYHLGYATMENRSRKFLAPAGGENVANMFLYDYRANSRYYAQAGEQGYEFYTRSGQKIQRHTYLSFARMLVNGWMSSPGHRQNILDTDFELLGCGLHIGADALQAAAIPVAYGVQNFGFLR